MSQKWRKSGENSRAGMIPEWLRLPIVMLATVVVALVVRCYSSEMAWREFWQATETKNSILAFIVCFMLMATMNYIFWRIRSKIEGGEKGERK